MKQTADYYAKEMENEQISELLNKELIKFEKKWRGIMNSGDLVTLAKFVEQINESLKQPKQ